MFQTVSRGVILAVAFMLLAVAAEAQQFAAIVMDARTGKVIKAVNADTRVHPASLTKMMTLYIVFDQLKQGRLSLDQKITVSANAADEPPSRLGLKAGQKIELRYLIRAAAIKSANDAATAMGDYIGGSEPGVRGADEPVCPGDGHDQHHLQERQRPDPRRPHDHRARHGDAGRRLIYDFPQYYNIFGRVSTSAGLATVKNTNRRVLEAYPGADGIKTGYTKAAGFNVVTSAQRGNRRVIVALLGGKSTAPRNAEAERLMDLGFAEHAGGGARWCRRRRCAACMVASRRAGQGHAAPRSTATVVAPRRAARWRSTPPAGRCRARSTPRRSAATARRSPRRSPR